MKCANSNFDFSDYYTGPHSLDYSTNIFKKISLIQIQVFFPDRRVQHILIFTGSNSGVKKFPKNYARVQWLDFIELWFND